MTDVTDGGLNVPDSPDAADLDDMTDEEFEEWRRQQEETLESAAEEGAELDADQQQALDALKAPVEEDLQTVELRSGVQVEVKTYLSAEMEDNLDTIEENRRDLETVRDVLPETLAWLIEDDQYGGEKGRAVWEAYAEEHGVMSLAELFFKTVEPALDRMEDSEAARKFRGD